MKKFLYSNTIINNDIAVNLVSGAFCRASVGFLFMPISVVKVRFEVFFFFICKNVLKSNIYNYKTIGEAFSDIMKSGGVKGLFSGAGVTIMVFFGPFFDGNI